MRLFAMSLGTILAACGGEILTDSAAPPREAGGVDARDAPGTNFDSSFPEAARADTQADTIGEAATCVRCGEGGCTNTNTDTANCGGCGRVCAERCLEGHCFLQLSSADGTTGLAVDSNNVYFTAYDGMVRQVPIGGGTTTVLVKGLSGPWGIAVDDTTVYYADPAIPTGGMGATIGSVPIGGGPNKVLLSGQIGGLLLAVAAGNVYWNNGGFVGATGEIAFVPVSGGSSSLLVPLDTAGYISVSGMTVSGGTMFYSEEGTGIFTIPLSGGSPTMLSAAPADELALDATNIYFSQGGTIRRVPRAGGAETVLAKGQSGPTGIAVDATDVYFTNNYGINQSSLRRVPIAGGAVTTLVSGLSDTGPVVVDAANVYWVCINEVYQLTK